MTAARLAAVRAVLDRWERTAQAATAGPWVIKDLGDETFTSANNKGWWWVWQESALPYYGGVLEQDRSCPHAPVGCAGRTDNEDGEQERADAEHIATFDPPAVLALVGYLRRQAVGVEWLLRDPGTPTALNAALSNLAALESAVGIDHVTTTEESP